MTGVINLVQVSPSKELVWYSYLAVTKSFEILMPKVLIIFIFILFIVRIT